MDDHSLFFRAVVNYGFILNGIHTIIFALVAIGSNFTFE